MDKAHPFSSPMIVQYYDVKKDPFRSRKDNKGIIGLEVQSWSAIRALMSLANKQFDIAFHFLRIY